MLVDKTSVSEKVLQDCLEHADLHRLWPIPFTLYDKLYGYTESLNRWQGLIKG
jgi:hypothetical protein